MTCYYCGCEVNPAAACAIPTWFGSAYCCKKCYNERKEAAA